MRVLAIETSTATGGVALVVDGRLVHREISSQQRSHGELLNVFIEKCLDAGGLSAESLDLIAVGRGPGSFTGLRVAAGIAKSLSYSLSKPLVAVDSATLLANQEISSADIPDSRLVMTLVNAHKNLLYAAMFRLESEGPSPLQGVQVVDTTTVESWTKDRVLCLGDGFDAFQGLWSTEFQDRVVRSSSLSDHPDPFVLGRMAESELRSGRVIDWKLYSPLYLRASEAEEKLRGMFLKPLASKDQVHGKRRAQDE